MPLVSARGLALAIAIALFAPPVFADGTAEGRKLRVSVDIFETVTPGSTFEVVINFENLTDRTIGVRSQVCMRSPFGPLCGPMPAPPEIEPNRGVEVAALFLCEAWTPPGDYEVTVVVKSGKETLTVPHTITVVGE